MMMVLINIVNIYIYIINIIIIIVIVIVIIIIIIIIIIILHHTSYIIHDASVFIPLLEYPYSIMILTSDIFFRRRWQRSFETRSLSESSLLFLSYHRICISNKWNRYEQLYWVPSRELTYPTKMAF